MNQVRTICSNFDSHCCHDDPRKHKIFHQNEVLAEKGDRGDTMICVSIDKDQSTSQITKKFRFRLKNCSPYITQKRNKCLQFEDLKWKYQIRITIFSIHCAYNSAIARYWTRENYHRHFDFSGLSIYEN